MDNITNLVEDYKNKIGTVLGTSSWIKIDQNMINDFASIKGRNNRLKVAKAATRRENNVPEGQGLPGKVKSLKHRKAIGESVKLTKSLKEK